MAAIRAKNTEPEIVLRKGLHRRGFRYGLHSANVLGKPDLVFRSRRSVIFVHGCFWHGHDCSYFRLPSTRPEFWRKKIESNRRRDTVVADQLRASGWRVLTVWECATRDQGPKAIELVLDRAARWLNSNACAGQIRGHRS
ncbi:MAG: very short patch repair endonuclease [Rhizomicrobium sp.]